MSNKKPLEKPPSTLKKSFLRMSPSPAKQGMNRAAASQAKDGSSENGTPQPVADYVFTPSPPRELDAEQPVQQAARRKIARSILADTRLIRGTGFSLLLHCFILLVSNAVGKSILLPSILSQEHRALTSTY